MSHILHELETKGLIVYHDDYDGLITSLSILVANISDVHILFDHLHNVEHLRLKVVCMYQYIYLSISAY